MISHKYKCIFIHLRRTGGNSIEWALEGLILLDENGNIWQNDLHRGQGQDTPYKKGLRDHKMHDHACKIRRLYPDEFESYFKISIVRKPWDQMLSLFFRRQERKNVAPLEEWDKNVETFRLWIRNFTLIFGTVPRQTLYDNNGNCLVDYIWRLETFQDDFAEICKRIGIEEIELPHHNADRNSPNGYRFYYDDETREKVSSMFSNNIKLFGYEF